MSKEDDAEEDQNASIGVGRYPCMPSLVALQQMRNRLHLAYLGKKLMKWTALATGRELRKIAIDLNDTYGDFSDELSNAYIMLARARYFYPNLNNMVTENPQKKAFVSLSTTSRTVSGVKVLQFEIVEAEQEAYPYLGIDKGGQCIKQAKDAWYALLKRMILILQLRNSFASVEYAHKSATKKQNVLAKVIVPRLTATLAYILSELEEREREDNFRLKRFKQLKTKMQAATLKMCTCCLSMFRCGKDIYEPICSVCAKGMQKGRTDIRVVYQPCENVGKELLKYLDAHLNEIKELAMSFSGKPCCTGEDYISCLPSNGRPMPKGLENLDVSFMEKSTDIPLSSVSEPQTALPKVLEILDVPSPLLEPLSLPPELTSQLPLTQYSLPQLVPPLSSIEPAHENLKDAQQPLLSDKMSCKFPTNVCSVPPPLQPPPPLPKYLTFNKPNVWPSPLPRQKLSPPLPQRQPAPSVTASFLQCRCPNNSLLPSQPPLISSLKSPPPRSKQPSKSNLSPTPFPNYLKFNKPNVWPKQSRRPQQLRKPEHIPPEALKQTILDKSLQEQECNSSILQQFQPKLFKITEEIKKDIGEVSIENRKLQKSLEYPCKTCAPQSVDKTGTQSLSILQSPFDTADDTRKTATTRCCVSCLCTYPFSSLDRIVDNVFADVLTQNEPGSALSCTKKNKSVDVTLTTEYDLTKSISCTTQPDFEPCPLCFSLEPSLKSSKESAACQAIGDGVAPSVISSGTCSSISFSSNKSSVRKIGPLSPCPVSNTDSYAVSKSNTKKLKRHNKKSGYVERVEKIIKIKRTMNLDGSISEEKKVIIMTDKRAKSKQKALNSNSNEQRPDDIHFYKSHGKPNIKPSGDTDAGNNRNIDKDENREPKSWGQTQNVGTNTCDCDHCESLRTSKSDLMKSWESRSEEGRIALQMYDPKLRACVSDVPTAKDCVSEVEYSWLSTFSIPIKSQTIKIAKCNMSYELPESPLYVESSASYSCGTNICDCGKRNKNSNVGICLVDTTDKAGYRIQDGTVTVETLCSNLLLALLEDGTIDELFFQDLFGIISGSHVIPYICKKTKEENNEKHNNLKRFIYRYSKKCRDANKHQGKCTYSNKIHLGYIFPADSSNSLKNEKPHKIEKIKRYTDDSEQKKEHAGIIHDNYDVSMASLYSEMSKNSEIVDKDIKTDSGNKKILKTNSETLFSNTTKTVNRDGTEVITTKIKKIRWPDKTKETKKTKTAQLEFGKSNKEHGEQRVIENDTTQNSKQVAEKTIEPEHARQTKSLSGTQIKESDSQMSREDLSKKSQSVNDVQPGKTICKSCLLKLSGFVSTKNKSLTTQSSECKICEMKKAKETKNTGKLVNEKKNSEEIFKSYQSFSFDSFNHICIDLSASQKSLTRSPCSESSQGRYFYQRTVKDILTDINSSKNTTSEHFSNFEGTINSSYSLNLIEQEKKIQSDFKKSEALVERLEKDFHTVSLLSLIYKDLPTFVNNNHYIHNSKENTKLCRNCCEILVTKYSMCENCRHIKKYSCSSKTHSCAESDGACSIKDKIINFHERNVENNSPGTCSKLLRNGCSSSLKEVSSEVSPYWKEYPVRPNIALTINSSEGSINKHKNHLKYEESSTNISDKISEKSGPAPRKEKDPDDKSRYWIYTSIVPDTSATLSSTGEDDNEELTNKCFYDVEISSYKQDVHSSHDCNASLYRRVRSNDPTVFRRNNEERIAEPIKKINKCKCCPQTPFCCLKSDFESLDLTDKVTFMTPAPSKEITYVDASTATHTYVHKLAKKFSRATYNDLVDNINEPAIDLEEKMIHPGGSIYKSRPMATENIIRSNNNLDKPQISLTKVEMNNNKHDASTNTKRSEKYDVRTLSVIPRLCFKDSTPAITSTLKPVVKISKLKTSCSCHNPCTIARKIKNLKRCWSFHK